MSCSRHTKRNALLALDELTQIPNRRFLYEHAEIEIARCIRNKETFNVLAIDCDDFKKINDTLGHLTGDKVLQVVAQTLQNNLRKADILARMGGDEFTILLSEIDPSNARKVALKLYKQLTGAMLAHGWPVGFSLGLASCSNLENVTLEELLHKADIAMYESKVNETDITEVSSC